MKLEENSQHSALNELYREAARDLLCGNGIDINLLDPCAEKPTACDKPCYVSVLGAIGNGLALSSMLAIDADLLARIHPLSSSAVSEPELEDWCRELNNQLVGRMKNKLLRYDIAVNLGLPTLLTGNRIKAVSGPELTVMEHVFQFGDNSMALTLSIFVEAGFELKKTKSDAAEGETLTEGCVALF
jgi:hypothetical protein